MVGKEHLVRRSDLIRMLTAICSIAVAVAGFAVFANAGMAPVVPAPADPAAAIKLPVGFEAKVFARLDPAGREYFRGPRFMAFGPDGNLYLSLGLANKVVMLPDRNHDGRADEILTVSDRLNGPQGLAFIDEKLYVANQDGIVRMENGQAVAVVSGLPSGGHTLKTLKLGPDGYLYLNVGSSCNVCKESDPQRATIQRYTIDGKPAGRSGAVWAEGLRNSEGFAWHPETGVLYATNNGADMRSDSKGAQPVDDLPPEHLNRIDPGSHYGWPHCWGGRHADPDFPGPHGFCANTTPPAITFPAHSAPLGITFLDRSAFPTEYRGDALVALHGSWNRREPAGYKLVRVHFEAGKPVRVEDFANGWLIPSGAWGRPVDVIVGPDGAVYVSDDRAGMIYRITYRGNAK